MTPEERLQKFSERLNGQGKLRISRRAVPHVVVDLLHAKASVAYFHKGSFYRVFFPYGVFGKQKKWSFKEEDKVLEKLRELWYEEGTYES
jgi:hypothetical protein